MSLFIWIPLFEYLVLVYSNYKYFLILSVRVTVFIRQNLTYKDGPHAEKVNTEKGTWRNG